MKDVMNHMQNEKKIVFNVIIKSSHSPKYNELRPKCDRYEDKATRRSMDRAGGVNLDSCFSAYS